MRLICISVFSYSCSHHSGIFTNQACRTEAHFVFQSLDENPVCKGLHRKHADTRASDGFTALTGMLKSKNLFIYGDVYNRQADKKEGFFAFLVAATGDTVSQARKQLAKSALILNKTKIMHRAC